MHWPVKYWHYTVLVFFAMLLLTDVKISLEWNRKCWTLSPGATDKLSQSYKMAATGRHFTTLRHISLKVVVSVYVCCWHVSLLSEQLLFWATVWLFVIDTAGRVCLEIAAPAWGALCFGSWSHDSVRYGIMYSIQLPVHPPPHLLCSTPNTWHCWYVTHLCTAANAYAVKCRLLSAFCSVLKVCWVLLAASASALFNYWLSQWSMLFGSRRRIQCKMEISPKWQWTLFSSCGYLSAHSRLATSVKHGGLVILVCWLSC